MAKKTEISAELRARIAAVTNKRARFVLDRIVEKGLVTTEEINQAGYDHPPRAAGDARDLGFPLKTIKVKHSNGRSIAAYTFPAEGELQPGKQGRWLLPKKERDALIGAAGNKCQICSSEHNLEVDHCIPYEVAGELQWGKAGAYQILCGSCNRKKSWACEHCPNRLKTRSVDVCRSCYWAAPNDYEHVATQRQRRVDLVWTGNEVADYELLKNSANRHQHSVRDEIKDKIKKKPSGK